MSWKITLHTWLEKEKPLLDFINENHDIPVQEIILEVRKIVPKLLKEISKVENVEYPSKYYSIPHPTDDYNSDEIKKFFFGVEEKRSEMQVMYNIRSGHSLYQNFLSRMIHPINDVKKLSEREFIMETLSQCSPDEYKKIGDAIESTLVNLQPFLHSVYYETEINYQEYYPYEVYKHEQSLYPHLFNKIKSLFPSHQVETPNRNHLKILIQSISQKGTPEEIVEFEKIVNSSIDNSRDIDDTEETQKFSIQDLEDELAIEGFLEKIQLNDITDLINGHLTESITESIPKQRKITQDLDHLLTVLKEKNLFYEKETFQHFYLICVDLFQKEFYTNAKTLLNKYGNEKYNIKSITKYLNSKIKTFLDSYESITYLFEIAKFIQKNAWGKVTHLPSGNNSLEGVFHPIISKEKQILNPGYKNENLIIISAAHGSGKSFWLSSQILSILYAQTLNYAPCEKGNLPTYEGIYFFKRGMTRTEKGLSAGTGEMHDLEQFFAQVKPNSIVFLDEPGSTMADEDQFLLLKAILEEAFAKGIKVVMATNNTRFQNHIRNLNIAKQYSFDSRWENGEVHTDHKLLENQSFQSFAIEIAKSTGISEKIFKFAEMFENKIDFNISRTIFPSKKSSTKKISDFQFNLLDSIQPLTLERKIHIFNSTENQFSLKNIFSSEYLIEQNIQGINHGKFLENLLFGDGEISSTIRQQRKDTLKKCKENPKILDSIIQNLKHLSILDYQLATNKSQKDFNNTINIFRNDGAIEKEIKEKIEKISKDIDFSKTFNMDRNTIEHLEKRKKSLYKNLLENMNWSDVNNIKHAVFIFETNRFLCPKTWQPIHEEMFALAKSLQEELEHCKNEEKENKTLNRKIHILLRRMRYVRFPAHAINEISIRELTQLDKIVKKFDPKLKANFSLMQFLVLDQNLLLIKNLVETKKEILQIFKNLKSIDTPISENILKYFKNILSDSSYREILSLKLKKGEKNSTPSFGKVFQKDIIEIKNLLEFLSEMSSSNFNEVSISDHIDLKEATTNFLDNKNYKRNSIDFKKPLSIITGPNGSGKSIILNVLCENIQLARNWGVANAAEGSTIPDYSEIFFFDRIEGDIESGKSSYYKEIGNIQVILSKLEEASKKGEKCLIIFDELGSTTTPADQSKLQVGIISYIIELGHDVVCSTHNHDSVSFLESKFPHFTQSYHLGFQLKDDEIHFDYHPLKEGHEKSYGILVAQKMMPHLREKLKQVLEDESKNQ